MGGYSSGRPAYRALMEGQRRFDIRRLRSRPLIAGTSGVWTWTSDGKCAGQMGYAVRDGWLEFRYRICPDAGTPVDICIRAMLLPRSCRFGGRSNYLRCPRCYRTSQVLIMFAGGRQWGCRRCLRLSYQSQRLTPAYRLQQRADKLYARAGTDYGDGMVVKRKWMRWRTFNRLVDRANALTTKSDALFLYGLRRFGWAVETIEDAMEAVSRDSKPLPSAAANKGRR